MKNQPLFKNKMAFDIDVPTPNGGGRIVPSGCYISGTFFYDLFRQAGLIQLMPNDHKYNPKDLICHYDKVGEQTVAEAKHVEVRQAEADNDAKVEEVRAAVKKAGRPRKDVYTSMEESIEAGMKESKG